MNRLIEIGFKYAGNWRLNGDQLDCDLKNHATSKNVLYAFVSNGDIRYIGKTTQQLKSRFSGYRNPGKTQSTNINNNANIRSLLVKEEPVDIFILPDNGLLNYGGFPINLAAGLEDSLIQHILPPWNGGNREEVEKPDQQSEDNTLAELSTPEPKDTFDISLGKAYYNQGFFNVPVQYQELFGSDGEQIEIYLGDVESTVKGYINRTANTNATPRIMGGKDMTQWLKEGFNQGDSIKVDVLSSCSVMIHEPNG